MALKPKHWGKLNSGRTGFYKNCYVKFMRLLYRKDNVALQQHYPDI